jgi:predicted ABC-type ATPase
MADPVLHLLAGPNGAGKSTLYEKVIGPATNLEFVNADVIAARRWPEDPEGQSYAAAALASERRAELLGQRASFVTETVFSHESKLDLVNQALDAGYLVELHVVIVPEDLAVARVVNRAQLGGHTVPEAKVRARFRRLWPLVATAILRVDHGSVYDNSRTAHPFRLVAAVDHGTLLRTPDWPTWTPKELRNLA